MDTRRKPTRTVRARRTAALGGVAAIALTSAAPALAELAPSDADESGFLLVAQAEGEGEGEMAASAEGEGEMAASAEGEGEGEGEGGGQNVAPEVGFLRDLGFMAGHMRAGMALYEAGEVADAKTHMGHPIEEKYEAVAEPLEARGFGDLKGDILAVVDAVESEADVAEVRSRFDAVIEKIDAVRDASEGGAAAQLMALAALTRIAADEYEIAITDGEVTNLHEYQDAWGFLRTVESEAGEFAQSDDPAVAAAAETILEQVAVTADAFGDLKGEGIPKPDSALIYGPAARMEIAAMRVGG